MVFTSETQLINHMKQALVRHDEENPVLEAKYRAYRGAALVRIFENQTRDEQVSESTNRFNGIGFTGSDAKFLTSLAKQYQRKGFISDKQDIYLRRKIVKYAGQLVRGSIAEGKIKKENGKYVW